MTVVDLIGFYQEQINVVDRIWWYFYSVTFVVLGFTIGSNKATKTYLEVAIISVGYISFSIGSAISLWHAQVDLLLFSKLVKGKDSTVLLNPIPEYNVVFFQAVIVTAVIGAVLVTHIIRNKRPNK